MLPETDDIREAMVKLKPSNWRNDSFLISGPITLPDEQRRVARVRRHRHTGAPLYSLSTVPTGPRNRWGTFTEIASDAEHFRVTGHLPPPIDYRF